ncbi:MAG: SIS domain-containing protein [Candidatus Sumerlaeia bacterium]|nr:SIS domain-containing protein [Candidatus Sumerlaeia bacterium]
MNPHLKQLIDRYPVLEPSAGDIDNVYRALVSSFGNGGKLLLCGNGGSAADCDHWSGELLKGFTLRRPIQGGERERLGADLADHLQQGLPCLPLPNFTALLTAFANDVDATYGFAQLVQALGRPGDVLVGISTSGNAENVALAMKTARAGGIVTVGLTGRTGGRLIGLVDMAIRVPSDVTHEIQELHLPVYHTLCIMLEHHFFPGE